MSPGSTDAARELRDLLCASAPPEPAPLRLVLRALASDRPATAPAAIAAALGSVLFESWRAVLAPRGVVVEDLGLTDLAPARECWLWVMGDRTWNEIVGALAGRLARRVLAGSQAHAQRPLPRKGFQHPRRT